MKTEKELPPIPVPPGMKQWVEAEADRLGLVFIGTVTELDPTAPGHAFEEGLEIPAPAPVPRLRPV